MLVKKLETILVKNWPFHSTYISKSILGYFLYFTEYTFIISIRNIFCWFCRSDMCAVVLDLRFSRNESINAFI